jgi:group I intron endonuclease
MHVYLIQNKANGKVYVGQHAGDDLDAYLNHNIRHALSNQGNKLFLYRAIRKYGADAFDIRTIYTPVDKQDMDNAEIAFIKFFGSQNEELGYNITAGGGGRLGTHNPHSEETKAKMSAVRKGKPKSKEWAEKIAAPQRGRSLTPEHIAALRAGQKGCKKPPRTEEHKAKLVASRLANRLKNLEAQNANNSC